MEHHPKTSVGHETRDANLWPIVLTGIGLAVTVAIVGLISAGVFRYLDAHAPYENQTNPMAAGDPQIPPPPRIEEHPAIEIQQLHQQEDQILTTYGWMDKKAGIVRIPIDRAMELQLQRGFPTRTEIAKARKEVAKK